MPGAGCPGLLLLTPAFRQASVCPLLFRWVQAALGAASPCEGLAGTPTCTDVRTSPTHWARHVLTFKVLLGSVGPGLGQPKAGAPCLWALRQPSRPLEAVGAHSPLDSDPGRLVACSLEARAGMRPQPGAAGHEDRKAQWVSRGLASG